MIIILRKEKVKVNPLVRSMNLSMLNNKISIHKVLTGTGLKQLI